MEVFSFLRVVGTLYLTNFFLTAVGGMVGSAYSSDEHQHPRGTQTLKEALACALPIPYRPNHSYSEFVKSTVLLQIYLTLSFCVAFSRETEKTNVRPLRTFENSNRRLEGSSCHQKYSGLSEVLKALLSDAPSLGSTQTNFR